MECRHSGSPHPKKFRVQKSSGKVLASTIWDQDILLIIFQGAKLSTPILSLPVRLKDILEEKRRGKVTKLVLFLHDNAPAHRALATQKKLAYLGFQCLDHPPCSPDLAPLDYHLFPGLKNNWKVAIFRPTRRSLLLRRPGWTNNLLSFFLSGLQKLEQWTKKCIELRGVYAE